MRLSRPATSYMALRFSEWFRDLHNFGDNIFMEKERKLLTSLNYPKIKNALSMVC